ncbi:MAG: nicotinate (nicotinamide) nucleotide adenylyltransferase [Acidimicrobiia bacterium]|nr:nicotinate (nicotinamide) nucleotide adenylyltransferase [Acidimicrobiia bacterium]
MPRRRYPHDVRIGILGGTFDPLHIAHLHAGEVAYRQLDLDEVRFMPAGAPWQKAGRQVSDAAARLEMARLATEEVDYFTVDDREVHRDGWTYTADTLASFPAQDELFLILGADAAAGVPSWNRTEDVVERATIAVAPRTNSARSEVDAVLTGHVWLEMSRLDVSGTELRAWIASGRSPRFLVTDPVWWYLRENDLYS